MSNMRKTTPLNLPGFPYWRWGLDISSHMRLSKPSPKAGWRKTHSVLSKYFFRSDTLHPWLFFPLWTASNLDLPRATYTQPSSAAQLSRTEPVRAFTTTQDAEGLTQEDLDQAALENFEWWIIEEMLAKGKERFGQKGNNPSDFRPNVAVDSSYFSIDGIKLAIINANFSDMVRFIFIFGFKGEQFHKVSCFRPSNHDIPMWTGPCGDEILETFGVTIRQ